MGVRAASPLRLDLAPWELLFLEIVPRSEVKETVVMGARWYRDAGGAAYMVPEPGVDRVRVLAAGGSESTLHVTLRERGLPSGKIVSQAIRPLPESDWLAAAPASPGGFLVPLPGGIRLPGNPESPAGGAQRETRPERLLRRRVLGYRAPRDDGQGPAAGRGTGAAVFAQPLRRATRRQAGGLTGF